MSKEEKTNSSQEQGWIIFKKHMPKSNNLTLIILKGHLLIEQEMNRILDLNLTESKTLFDARLTFSHRLAIIRAIYGSSDCKLPYKNIEKLNTLRNQLVHNLEPKNLEKKF